MKLFPNRSLNGKTRPRVRLRVTPLLIIAILTTTPTRLFKRFALLRWKWQLRSLRFITIFILPRILPHVRMAFKLLACVRLSSRYVMTLLIRTCTRLLTRLSLSILLVVSRRLGITRHSRPLVSMRRHRLFWRLLVILFSWSLRLLSTIMVMRRVRFLLLLWRTRRWIL